MASDPGILGPDHIYVTSVESGYFPGSGMTNPVLSSISPTSVPAGPASDVTLTATGSGFAANAAIGFGTAPDGTPRFERTTFVNDTTLETVITAGYFPNPDPSVPVVVANDPPFGPATAVVDFAFT